MHKLVPVLGTIVLLGAIAQVVLGFEVAAYVPGLREIHMGVGILGLVLVAGLLVLAFRAKTGIVYSKLTMAVLTVVVLVQVALGFQLLSGAYAMLASHAAVAYLIVALALVTGGMTFWNSMRARRTVAHV